MTLRDSLVLLGIAASSAVWLVACDDAMDADAGVPPDASADAGATDSGGVDAAAGDSGSVDSGSVDSGSSDSGSVDSGSSDSGSSDSGTAMDAGTADGGGTFGTAMSFFVSSTPVFDAVGFAATGDITGDGNLIFTLPGTSPPVVLRGVEAADAHCRSLAAAAGNPRPTWVAYLSTQGLPVSGSPGVNGPQIDARDRIGTGPWYNASGDLITDLAGTTLLNATLHVSLGVVLGEGRDADDPANRTAVAAYNAARPNEALMLTEMGAFIAGSSHDLFTGSDDDGTVYDGGYAERWSISQRTTPPGGRTRWGTCNDWDWQRFGAAPGTEFAQVGHPDIPTGGFSPSWSSAHDTGSCTPGGVTPRGGAGHVYCFSPD